MKKIISSFTLVFLAVLLAACGASKEVKRIDTSEVIDLSGRWNDTDARLTAEEMVTDALKRPWLTDFMTEKGKKPVVIVGKVRNKSSEQIEVEIFTNDIERELLNSGKVSFVAAKEERDDVREERKDQNDFASKETFKQFYKEIGADFLLAGDINSVADFEDGKKVILYQVDLQLIDIETNMKVWLGNKKIKKFIERDSYKP
ncbi:MAG: penicillin-binding protein activator LpoB [Ignavibacteriales bacterium]|nr:penicillin-binding protein activator LpoB [Ignavibacteriales bacterium]MCF8305535.1 penicillin-binding protein activator LpoB [Ignavibacteriales bacterium]MCF8315257.1 penicillin-binding protein activator LpoB [Ignavibacteriales bacterium]MCF8436851.1 penicillin-binding protein activator LpoB [Ignavibacteriales bacterium]